MATDSCVQRAQLPLLLSQWGWQWWGGGGGGTQGCHNLWLTSDSLKSIQVIFFSQMGVVSDNKDGFWWHWRSSADDLESYLLWTRGDLRTMTHSQHVFVCHLSITSLWSECLLVFLEKYYSDMIPGWQRFFFSLTRKGPSENAFIIYKYWQTDAVYAFFDSIPHTLAGAALRQCWM